VISHLFKVGYVHSKANSSEQLDLLEKILLLLNKVYVFRSCQGVIRLFCYENITMTFV